MFYFFFVNKVPQKKKIKCFKHSPALTNTDLVKLFLLKKFNFMVPEGISSSMRDFNFFVFTFDFFLCFNLFVNKVPQKKKKSWTVLTNTDLVKLRSIVIDICDRDHNSGG